MGLTAAGARLPSPTPGVVWAEGMHLAPHHFQAQRQHVEDAVAATLGALFPFAWGVTAVELDADALRNGTLALVHARGLLPDATPFDLPGADALPPPRALADRFSPTRDAHVVHLALAPRRAGAANVADDARAADRADPDRADGARAAPAGAPEDAAEGLAGARYRAVTRLLADEGTGADPLPVRFAAHRFRLLLDEECGADDVTLPLARVRRDGAGRFELDETHVPPCLQLAASPRLLALLQGIVEMLGAKGGALAATLAAAPAEGGGAAAPGAAAYAGNEVATRWLLHAVRSAEAPLRDLLATRRAHPERLWLELSRLAGALCTFALGTTARELPLYDHDALGECFAALVAHVRARLDVVVAPRALVVALVPAPQAVLGGTLHAAGVADPRAHAPGARWFLGVRAAGGAAALAGRVPQYVKLCSSRFVPELVRRAYPGLPLVHLPTAPAAIAPRRDTAYFTVALDGPCAQAIRDARDVGAYVPDALADAALELVVLLPE